MLIFYATQPESLFLILNISLTSILKPAGVQFCLFVAEIYR